MLEVEGIEAGYGEHVVVRDVSLSVPSGSVVAVLGPNGAGKTTLLRAVSGLLRPRKGTVRLDGQDVTRWRPHQLAAHGVCHITEGRGVFPSLTVRENLILQSPKGRESESIDRAAQVFPILGERLGQTAGSLSGGEQQILALTRAYLCEPRLVLVDEASLGLAPAIVDTIFAFLARLAAAGTTLVVVEQYVYRALAIADRAYILVHGQVAAEGEAATMGEREVFRTYLGAAA